MIRTQIQLPNELYQRAKAFASARELSLAELARRGLELFLDRFPDTTPPQRSWVLPKIDGGGIKIPLDRLRDVTADEESWRGCGL